ncbi:TlpA family protein disulfide reductase [Rouxiella badensis]|uniref:TlpA disulfide reductase family protein n=1 Tax=Enterobacterales TaxID=91347 RepID=UPI000E54E3C0|nr:MULTISPECIES: TlpA disulfide reductase family protein [Enterobacterales]AXU94783.1 redoxin [Erwinia persicina]MBD0902074.1 TlpA family protein disulfide reductase [Klebsiella grimontii]MCC3735776.1 TlpA family protein disulfide reductase [Rouxiella badensis]MCC3761130.1 TlpA family protein disulfide reductase [Rouxiella badensis]MCX2943706.1 TlpA disulfide reductase family protein [Rahnella perminowiae]
MISIGPFSVRIVAVFLAVLLAWAVALLVAKRLPDSPYKAAGGMLLDAVFLGLVAARLGYIAQWWEEYAQSPMSMIFIGDQGFSLWVGVLAALAFVWWLTRSIRALRRPVLVGITAGLLAWFAAGGVLDLLQRSAPPLPALTLATLDEKPVVLNSYTGRPVVLNLWASWCPPCRREMPVFEQAQAQYPDIAFVMVNQGESAPQARAFLEAHGLQLKDVLLDPASQTMQAVASRGLPTTLFFDEHGRLVDVHLGELSIASLKNTVSRRFAPSQIKTDKE